jgi:glycosyltransferase involved in cell wall biosynthesis
LTFNEEANIAPCLDTVVDWAGEVFIVDSGSTDRTFNIISQYDAQVIHHPFENYSRQRNWAQASLPLTQQWVFHIDADERVSPQLISELKRVFATESKGGATAGFLVRRQIQFLGRSITHGGIYPTYHCRIFKKELGHCEDREYDQHFMVEGETETIEADLLEMTASSLFSWTARHNKWAQLEAIQLTKADQDEQSNMVKAKLSGSPIERRRWLRSRFYEKTPPFARAVMYFLTRYLLRGGFLDGTPGLIYHFLQGFWFRFYVDACYYELLQNRKPFAPISKVKA